VPPGKPVARAIELTQARAVFTIRESIDDTETG
jgi:hypothetical protein